MEKRKNQMEVTSIDMANSEICGPLPLLGHPLDAKGQTHPQSYKEHSNFWPNAAAGVQWRCEVNG